MRRVENSDMRGVVVEADEHDVAVPHVLDRLQPFDDDAPLADAFAFDRLVQRPAERDRRRRRQSRSGESGVAKASAGHSTNIAKL